MHYRPIPLCLGMLAVASSVPGGANGLTASPDLPSGFPLQTVSPDTIGGFSIIAQPRGGQALPLAPGERPVPMKVGATVSIDAGLQAIKTQARERRHD